MCVFLPFLLVRIVPLPFGVLRKDRGAIPNKSIFCIEAGIKGWELIEFKEFYMSACEYLGKDRVHKVQIKKEDSYLKQVKKALNEKKPGHYFYDPRTGSQHWLTGVWQAFNIAIFLHLHGIIPIVLLTDFSYRKWRAQSAIVTAKRGVVVTFVPMREVYPLFPHRRIIAPALLPISETTLTFLDDLYVKRPKNLNRRACFIGSLYEPRTTILREIAENLNDSDFSLEIRGRELGSARFLDYEYWSTLSNELIIITTVDQLYDSGKDWFWVKQLVYRYIEVIASGALLVAPEIPGVRRFFVPGVHFASFTTPVQASKVIEYYLTNEAEREKIARKGREKAKALIEAHSFWIGVDIMLGKDSFT